MYSLKSNASEQIEMLIISGVARITEKKVKRLFIVADKRSDNFE